MLPYPQHHLLGQGRNTLARKALAISRTRRRWVINTFTSTSTFNTICGYTNSNNIRILCCHLVIAEALLRAIPSLDIVLTPNGFGIVSTNNITPASKPRIDRLIGSMLSHRDDCIAASVGPNLSGQANGSNLLSRISSERHFSRTSAL